ncbi:MAG: nitrile hydratase subunit beta [Chloroflexota bacterium]
MNGVHDMGGMHGMGPISPEPNEPVFHEQWEGRVFALTRVLRLGPKWNVDQARYSIERIPPARYLASSYYERWLLGLERRLLESGTLSPEELAGGTAQPGPSPAPAMTAVDPRASPRPTRAPAFKVGDRVIARKINPVSHTRLPRYVRGQAGVIERDLGVQSFPDTWVAHQDHKPQHVYSVRFAAQELWGPAAPARDAVYVDLWDDYLDPA